MQSLNWKRPLVEKIRETGSFHFLQTKTCKLINYPTTTTLTSGGLVDLGRPIGLHQLADGNTGHGYIILHFDLHEIF